MFTGIVKLAQVDDYINPGQNCIQPKIMKKDKQPEKATVSLNDCLACSGCITSAESVLIEQMSITKLLSILEQDKQRPVVVIVAPQVVLSIAHKYQLSVQCVFQIIQDFWKNKMRADLVLDLWQGIQLSHQLIHQQFLQRRQKTLLCSQCPGWVCYAQKTLNEQIVQLMSRVKSPQQILGRIIKQTKINSLIVSIMPCYDKKIESIRFDIEEGIKEVDLTITTTQFLQLYQSIQGHQINQSTIVFKETFKTDRLIYLQQPFCLLQDQNANGHLESLLARLGATITRKCQVKNADFIEYEATVDGKIVKMAKCYGFRNIQRIVQAIKRNKCEYCYVQIMACPGACNSGGGQPKIENMKPKQIAQRFKKISTPLQSCTELPFNEHLLADSNKFAAKYKVIEQTLTQAVMNW